MLEVKKSLAIIIPLYNPSENWKNELQASISKIKELFYDTPVSFFLINDGSEEGILDELVQLENEFKSLAVHSYTHNKGKGFAIQKGLLLAESDFYIYSDWDFPFGEQALLAVYQNLIETKADLCVGNRSQKYFDSLPSFRLMVSKGLRSFSRIYFGGKKIDTQSGLKGLTNKSKSIFLSNKTNSFVFEIEFIDKILKQNLHITSVDIAPKQNITFSDLKVKTILRESFNLLKIVCYKQ